jgi:hypothetical protein
LVLVSYEKGASLGMIVIARRSGRLGNRLFSFAHFIANSLEFGRYTVLCPVLQEYSRYFASWNQSWLCGFPEKRTIPGWVPNSLRTSLANAANGLVYGLGNPLRKGRIPLLHSSYHEVIDLHQPAKYDWKHNDFVDNVHRKIVISNGWVFWDHHNFVRHADSLRHFFRLQDVYAHKLQSLIAKMRSPERRTLVGIHMRRGDYQTHCGGKYYYSWSDYNCLMQRISEIITDKMTFLLCSEETIPMEAFQGFEVKMGPGSPVEDMYALSGCDYLIGPPSSFSGWASFIGNVPIYFMEDISQAISHLKRDDFLPMTSFDYQNEANNYRWGGE